jgi:hypothetical protein
VRVELADARPPLVFGGHAFVPLGLGHAWWCTRCFQPCPRWALDEGYWIVIVGRWCPGLFGQLDPPHSGTG